MDARGMVRKLVALAAVFSLTFSPALAMAGEIVDGSVPANGLPQAGDVGATWNGSAHKVLRSDADGILRVTEEYPHTNQFAVTTVASAQPVYWCLYTTLQPFGTVWTAYPYGLKVLNITKTATGATTAASVRLYVFGSEDGANFKPVMIPTTSNLADYADSAKQDTLKLLPFKKGGTSTTFSYYFPAGVYLGRYVQLYASKMDTVASSAVAITAAWAGREF